MCVECVFLGCCGFCESYVFFVVIWGRVCIVLWRVDSHCRGGIQNKGKVNSKNVVIASNKKIVQII